MRYLYTRPTLAIGAVALAMSVSNPRPALAMNCDPGSERLFVFMGFLEEPITSTGRFEFLHDGAEEDRMVQLRCFDPDGDEADFTEMSCSNDKRLRSVTVSWTTPAGKVDAKLRCVALPPPQQNEDPPPSDSEDMDEEAAPPSN